MSNRVALSIIVLLVVLGCPFLVIAEERAISDHKQPGHPSFMPPPPGEPRGEINAPPLKMVAPGIFEIGGVRILKKEERVEFPATVNMDKGLLEYLIVGTSGKLHESLLRTEVEPYGLQIALLMIGLEGSTNPLASQGEPRRPEGDPVTIWIRWQEGKQIKKARIEEWVLKGKNPMGPTPWIFTGSFVSNGVFMAQVEKSIVAVFHDPVALIDNPLPEGASDEVWFAREGKVPPPGTGVTVFIHKEPKPSN